MRAARVAPASNAARPVRDRYVTARRRPSSPGSLRSRHSAAPQLAQQQGVTIRLAEPLQRLVEVCAQHLNRAFRGIDRWISRRRPPRLVLPVIEEHVARYAKHPGALATACLVAIRSADDPQIHFLRKVFRQRRLAGEPAQITANRRAVPLEQASREAARTGEVVHIVFQRRTA